MNKSRAVTEARATWHKRTRFNPIRTLTPENLARQLDAFEYGDLREAALLWDVLERRDDTLKCVAAKRKAAPSRLPWEILTRDESPAAARQKEVLEDFYDNLVATDALDRNRRGGVTLLIRQMMDAVGKKYSAHNLLWTRNRFGIRVEAQHVPLWFFENRTCRLRYLKNENDIEGEELNPGAWLVTVGEGLMEASSIACTFKRLPYQDWLTYSERHGMPSIHGKTSASQGSQEWDDMNAAVGAFAAEWAIVTSNSDSIEKLDMSASGELPYPKLLERMDRVISALWRGADLSTMSAGTGEGSGASLQGDEADLLEDDDAQMISDTLNEQLDPWVLRLALGVTEPLAYFSLTRPQESNSQQERETDKFLLEAGVPLGVNDTYERYGRTPPDENERVLTRQPQPETNVPAMNERQPNADSVKAAEEIHGELLAKARMELAADQQQVLAPVAEAIGDLIQAADQEELDDAEYLARLQSFADDELPKLLSKINAAPATEETLYNILSTAFVNGAAEA